MFFFLKATGDTAQSEDVECFDDNYQGNKFKGAGIKKAHTSHPRKNEILYRKLASSIQHISVSLCNPTKRRYYNKRWDEERTQKDSEKIKIFKRKTNLEKSLQIEIKMLCEITLRNTDGKMQTLLLLKNMHSFIFYLVTKLVKGIYNQGEAVLSPPCYVNDLDPLPPITSLSQIFDIHLTKYAECMKCIQYVMEKRSFTKQIRDTFKCQKQQEPQNEIDH